MDWGAGRIVSLLLFLALFMMSDLIGVWGEIQKYVASAFALPDPIIIFYSFCLVGYSDFPVICEAVGGRMDTFSKQGAVLDSEKTRLAQSSWIDLLRASEPLTAGKYLFLLSRLS